jgi:hypothetical protein
MSAYEDAVVDVLHGEGHECNWAPEARSIVKSMKPAATTATPTGMVQGSSSTVGSTPVTSSSATATRAIG